MKPVCKTESYWELRIQWENETGKCYCCGGSGQQTRSVGINGTTYRECARCEGSGNAPHVSAKEIDETKFANGKN